MRKIRPGGVGSLVAAAVFSVAACGDDATSSGVDALRAALTPILSDAFVLAPGAFDAFERLAAALEGGPADGVMVTANGGAASFVVSIDLDGNGSRESVVTGSALFTSPELSLNDGATISLNVPSSSGFSNSIGASVVTQQSGTVIADEISGGRSAPGAETEIILLGGLVTVNLLSGVPSGSVEFEVLGQGAPVFGTVIIVPNGEAGWGFRVTGDGFEFTVP